MNAGILECLDLLHYVPQSRLWVNLIHICGVYPDVIQGTLVGCETFFSIWFQRTSIGFMFLDNIAKVDECILIGWKVMVFRMCFGFLELQAPEDES